MATVSKIPDLDSGVASPEATPEEQTTPEKILNMGTSSAADNDKTSKSNEDKTTESNSILEKKDRSLSLISQDDFISDDDDDNIDESLAERLMGLTEMFPNSVRSASHTITSKTMSFVKSAYSLSRQILWVGVSSSIILFAPVMFEIERFNVEEMVKQDRNRLVLGPGSAMSGPPNAPGLTPAPSR